jgi:transcription elongation factor GreA
VSSSDATAVTWLTQEAFDRLSQELQELIDNRPAMAKEINDRREEGDLKENGGYHAAREEQGKAEARIVHLQEMLRKAQVGAAPADDGVAKAGMVVTVRFGDSSGDDETETFLLGAREVLARHTEDDLRVYSPQSPLGSAILGKKPGESATFTAPNGKQVSVEIVAAKPFTS